MTKAEIREIGIIDEDNNPVVAFIWKGKEYRGYANIDDITTKE